MELRTLRYFLAVVEERHFGRAAIRAHVAQPALSQQIIGLETELGVKLFDRSTRRVEVTQAGTRFAEHARRIVEATDRAHSDMSAFANGRTGRVVVGLVGTATYDVLPRLTRLVHAELPEVDLQVRGEILAPRLLDGLASGEYDLALVRRHDEPRTRTGDGREFLWETLRTEELIAVLPSTHPLADAEAVDLAALQGETFVVHPSESQSTMHRRVLDACARAGFRPTVLEVSETATMVVSVAAGLGVALAPAPVRSLMLDGVAYRPLRHRETVDLLLARPVAASSPAVTAVAEMVRAAAEPDPS